MKRFFPLFLFWAFCSAMSAQRSFVLPNSEDGQSTLHVFLPAESRATGRAVVDCPGGGYGMVCMDYEGTDWAPYYNDLGIAYFVLKYRMPKGDRTVPVGDAEHAIRLVRDSAQQWHINPYDIGIMGFSAGGHLASTVATHADYASRPNFQILFYPVISMDKKRGHEGSSRNFLGADVDNEQVVKSFSNEQCVRRHVTPPAILFMANDDKVVPPLTNGVPYYMALRQHDVNASLHIYPSGGHGWRFNARFPYHYDMLQTLTRWLSELKTPRTDVCKVACVGNSITDGHGIDLSETRGYPAQLQRLLGPDYYVRNFGVSARTMLEKGDHPYMREYVWQDCKDFCPDVVVIKLGTNDSKDHNWVYKADFMGDMQKMIDELKALDSHPKIYLCYPVKAWKDTWTINDGVIVNEIIPIIDKLAKKNKLQVIDLHTPTSADSSLFQSDGIHPTEKGCKAMAEIVAQKVKGN